MSYINTKYHNYSLYKALLLIDDSLNTKKYVYEIEEMMLKTFNKSVPDTWPKWPKSLPRVEELVSAGFFYTGESGEVMCIECRVILCDWQNTEIPWSEHIKASPNCMLVKLHQI